MSRYYDKADNVQSQTSQHRFRSSNSSRASRNAPLSHSNAHQLHHQLHPTPNYVTREDTGSRGEYFPIPTLQNGSRRVPSLYSNDSPSTLPRAVPYPTTPQGFQHSPIPQYDRPLSSGLTRPGSPGPVAGAGEITNTEHGFTIELDVFRFRPEEIKVVLTDDLLSISGERFEYAGDGQTLRRSFSRKYSIPEDIHLDSIRSHLADSGLLIVNGSRKGWRETSISSHPRYNHHLNNNNRNVISTV